MGWKEQKYTRFLDQSLFESYTPLFNGIPEIIPPPQSTVSLSSKLRPESQGSYHCLDRFYSTSPSCLNLLKDRGLILLYINTLLSYQLYSCGFTRAHYRSTFSYHLSSVPGEALPVFFFFAVGEYCVCVHVHINAQKLW